MTQPVETFGPPSTLCSSCMFMDFAGAQRFYGHVPLAPDGIQLGWCRRYPARPAGPVSTYPAERKDYTLGVEWPEVRADDWCGDWKTTTGP